jgi:hypothetical protein
MFTQCPNCDFSLPGGNSFTNCEQCGQALHTARKSARRALESALRGIAEKAAGMASPLLTGVTRAIASLSRERAWRGGLWLLLVLTLVNLAWTFRQPLLGQPWLQRDLSEWGVTEEPAITWFRDLEAIRLQTRQLRPHETFAGILVLTATFISDADRPQPWPELELTLLDSAGRLLARRRFAPPDYLGRAPDTGEWLPPGVLVPVRLDFADPGSDVAGFEISFH